MNHYPKNGQKGDPEFSTRQVSNPSIQDLFNVTPPPSGLYQT